MHGEGFFWDDQLGIGFTATLGGLSGDRLPPPRIPAGHPGTCCLRCVAIPLEQACHGCPKLMQAQRDRERLRAEIRAELRHERENTKPRRWWRRLRRNGQGSK